MSVWAPAARPPRAAPDDPDGGAPDDAFWWPDLVALASYPRSGNTLLRRLVEAVTRTTTGSDARPDRPLVKALVDMGMRGEGVVDGSRVWCVKTHFPERVGYVRFAATRAVVLVRNPLDAVASNFHMLLTGTHTDSVADEDVVGGPFAHVWRAWVAEEALVWKRFHEHWAAAFPFGAATPSSAPDAAAAPFGGDDAGVLVVRYEDLVLHRAQELARVASFLYEAVAESRAAGDEILRAAEERLREVLAKPLADLGAYAPRSGSGSGSGSAPPAEADSAPAPSGALLRRNPRVERHRREPLELDPKRAFKSLRLFSDEQFRFVMLATKSELVRFGYWDALLAARPDAALGLVVGYVDHPLGACLRVADELGALEHDARRGRPVELNAFWSIRPRTADDPYGRGLDQRWKSALAALPAPRLKPAPPS